MKKQAAIFLPIAIAFSLAAVSVVPVQAQTFKVCKSEFALCTIALAIRFRETTNRSLVTVRSTKVIPPAGSRAKA
jgi:hypothetical protein